MMTVEIIEMCRKVLEELGKKDFSDFDYTMCVSKLLIIKLARNKIENANDESVEKVGKIIATVESTMVHKKRTLKLRGTI